MEDNSASVKKEFDDELESVKALDNKDSRLKVKILYTAFIFSFIFVLAGTVISLRNYYEKKSKVNNVVAIQPVVIQEY